MIKGKGYHAAFFRGGAPVDELFSRLQVRYRSDRFSRVGKRFGAIEYDPQNDLELEIRRVREADSEGRDSLHNELRKVYDGS